MYKTKSVWWAALRRWPKMAHFCTPYNSIKINIDKFSNLFTIRMGRKFVIVLSLESPPHLKCFATLLCEMSMSWKQQLKTSCLVMRRTKSVSIFLGHSVYMASLSKMSGRSAKWRPVLLSLGKVVAEIKMLSRRSARNCSIQQLLVVVGFMLWLGWVFGDY